MTDTTAYRLAWQNRRTAHEHDVLPDNATLPAGSPMTFRCPSCFAPIILVEDYLRKPKVCYDCLELVSRGLLRERPPGTWQWVER